MSIKTISVKRKIFYAMTILYAFLAIVLIVVTTVALSIEKNHTVNEQNYNSQKLIEENANLLKGSSKLNVGNLVSSYAHDINNQLNSYAARVYMFKSYIQDLYSEDSITPSNYSNVKIGVGLLGDTQISKVEEEIKRVRSMLDLSNNIVGKTDVTKPYEIDPENGDQACYYYVSASGFMVSNILDPSNFNGEIDRRERDWYIDTVKSGKLMWAKPYKDLRLDTNVVTCSVPVYKKNGELAGVFAADLYVDSICRNILKMDRNIMDYSFFLDADNGFLLGSEKDKTLQEFIQDGEITNALLDDIKEARENDINPNDFERDKVVVGSANIEATGWQVGVILNYDQVMGTADLVRQKTQENDLLTMGNITHAISVVAMGSIAVSIFILIFIQPLSEVAAYLITKPIGSLTDGIKKVSKGNLDYKILLDSKDEIQQLAEAFNDMTLKLKEYIENITKITAEKEKIHSELSVAKKIQASMLPSIFPAFPKEDEFDIYANMDPAKEVGGDFYDFFFIDKSHIAMLIADVSGKGVAAALFMVVAKTLLKNEAQNGGSIGTVLEKVNNKLCETNEEGMFVTAFAAVFDIKTGELVYANAGHNVPLIYRAKDKKFEWMKPKHGFVLAGMEKIKYKEEKTYLNKGDMLYLYTDGVTEAMNQQNELFSDSALYQTLNELNVKNMELEDILKSVRDKVDIFAAGAERSDDITMLIFKNKNVDYIPPNDEEKS